MAKLKGTFIGIAIILALLLYAKAWLSLPYFYLAITFLSMSILSFIGNHISAGGKSSDFITTLHLVMLPLSLLLVVLSFYMSFSSGEIRHLGSWPSEILVLFPTFFLDLVVPIVFALLIGVIAENRGGNFLVWVVLVVLATIGLKLGLARTTRFLIPHNANGTVTFWVFVIFKFAVTLFTLLILIIAGRFLLISRKKPESST